MSWCRHVLKIKWIFFSFLLAPRRRTIESENEAPAFLSETQFTEHTSIVDSLINVKHDDEWNAIQIDLKNTFNELNNIIAETEDIENFLINLKPLQEEIARLTSKEKEVLENLKLRLPESLILKLIGLVKSSKDLLKDIEDALKRSNISITDL